MANVFWLVVPNNYTENKATPTYTLAAQCHQLYMRQKLYKPQPTPLPITDRNLCFFKTRFLTWSP